jgi:hypothetical protein
MYVSAVVVAVVVRAIIILAIVAVAVWLKLESSLGMVLVTEEVTRPPSIGAVSDSEAGPRHSIRAKPPAGALH